MIRKSKYIKKNEPQNLNYSEIWQKARERQRRDAFIWKVGVFVMTGISMVGCYSIFWVLSR